MTVKNRPAAMLGAVMLVIGIAIFFAASHIQSGFSYDVVGPSVFPMIIGGGFIVSAVLIGLESIKFAEDPLEGPIHVWPVIIISVAIVLEALLIKRLGWVPMASILFIAGAWAFGDRRFLLNATFGVCLAVLILFAFNWGLGLDLPLGILTPIVPSNS